MVFYHSSAKVTNCGGLNVIGPQNPIGCKTIRKCSFVRVGMALLEEGVTVGAGIEVLYMLKPCSVSQITSFCL